MKFYQNDGKLSLAGQALFNAVKLAIRRVLPDEASEEIREIVMRATIEAVESPKEEGR